MLTTIPIDLEEDYRRLRQYRADPALSQSYLKQFAGVSKPKTEDSLKNGNLVDTLIMTPYHFDNIFYVSDGVFPEFTLTFARWIIDNTEKSPDFNRKWIDDPDSIILKAYEEFEYQTRWRTDTKLKHKDTILAAMTMLIDSEGKSIITRAEKEEAQIVANRAVAFILETYADLLKKGWTIHVQEDYRFEYRKYKCKCLLDFFLMSPDEHNREILPVDFKTTGFSLKTMHYQAQKIRYDIQAAFYTEGLAANYPEAFIHNFELIFYSSVDDTFERIILSDNDLLIGKFGMKTNTQYQVNIEGNHVTRSKIVYGFHQTFLLKDLDPSAIRKEGSLNGNAIWI